MTKTPKLYKIYWKLNKMDVFFRFRNTNGYENICWHRKKFLLKMRNHNHPIQDNVLPFNNKGEDTCIDSQSSVDYLNKSLELIGESPIKK